MRHPAKITFLEIDTAQPWGLASFGPACLAAYLRSHDHQATLLRVGPDQEASAVIDQLVEQAPDMIGLSLTTPQWPRAKQIVSAIRRALDIPVIAGGSHPSFAPDVVLAADGFDYVCIGEGEQALGELLSSHGEGTIQVANIQRRGGPPPELRPALAVHDDQPLPARDLLDEHHGVVHLLTQRGCPYACRFCAAGAWSKLYGGGTVVRRRSVEGVIDELMRLCEAGPMHYVVFIDDTFTLNPAWLEAFCRAYGHGLDVGFSINARPETVSPRTLGQLAEAGCRHVVYGVESGSDRIRRLIMGRQVSERQVLDAVGWTKQAGMMVTTNYMIGLPDETWRDIEQTLELNEQLDPDDLACFVFYPYPGTDLFDSCRSRGYLPHDWHQRSVGEGESILTLPELGPDAIKAAYGLFERAKKRRHAARRGQQEAR